MKITFKETNSALTCENNGDINISPKFIAKFGYIEGIDLSPKEFTFDGKGSGIGLNIKSGKVIELTKIYVVYGIRKDDKTNFVELIKAFYIREEADKHCSELLQKEDNPYREILWQKIVL